MRVGDVGGLEDEHPLVDRERMAAPQAESALGLEIADREPDRGVWICRVPAEGEQGGRPGRGPVGVDRYGMLIDIG